MSDKDYSPELIEAMSDHRAVVFAAESRLRDIADAAWLLGQERLAKQLIDIADGITTTADRLNGAVGGAIHGRLVDAEQATASMIAAAFAGMTISAKAGAP